MTRIENQCVGCATESYPCMGDACPKRNAEVHYCDRCGDELSTVYEVEGEELCEHCLTEMFKK